LTPLLIQQRQMLVPLQRRARCSKSFFGQLHNSLNGGSLGHGGTELRLVPPDADTLVPAPLLDVDTPVDDRPDP
jgi:hypothetical protein